MEVLTNKFSQGISDKLKNLLTEILDGNGIPNSWEFSTTTLIPKEAKERLITLLNMDYKIFVTIMTNRL